MRPHPLLERYHASESERVRTLRRWFDENATHYDRISQALSLGSGNWYRRRVLERLELQAGASVLDVACGTGVLSWSAQGLLGSGCRVVGLDPSLGMLQVARSRGVRDLVCARAERLPFEDGTFDCVLMGYALRHVEDLDRTFSEFRRVLTPAGKLLILEITAPESRWGRRVLSAYLGGVVPLFARWHGKSAQELFRYYWDTIDQCVAPGEILEALERNGFVSAERYAELGIFSEYHARAV